MLLLLLKAAQAGCGDLDELLTSAEEQLAALHLDEVHTTLAAVPEVLRCGSVAPPEQLARMWSLHGVTGVLEGDSTAASDGFSALHRVSPTHYRDAYGTKVRQSYEAASAAPVLPAFLEFTPELGANRAYLDGSPAQQSQQTTQGLHTVQLTDPNGTVVFAELFFLAANQSRKLATGVPPAPLPTVAIAEEPRERRFRNGGWLVAGGVTAGAGVAMGLVAQHENQVMRKTGSFQALDASYARQRTIGGVAYGLIGLSAASLTVYVARQI